MVSSTFLNLDEAKQQRIERALITEFSAHSLVTAQVARIIKDAGIARGSFYKYFTDLLDAYRWSLGAVMSKLDLHPDVLRNKPADAVQYCHQIKDSLDRIYRSSYLPFLKMFYEANEGILAAQHSASSHSQQLNSQRWAVMVLCHEAIKECLLHPVDQDHYLARLQDALQKLLGE